MTDRTPGPWYTTLGPFDIGAGYIFGPDNQPVAQMIGSTLDDRFAMAKAYNERAQFIVLACNAHDGLVSDVAHLRERVDVLTNDKLILRADNARLKSDNVRLVCEITNLKSETFALVRDMTAIEALEEIIRNVDLWKTSDNMAGRIYGIARAALAGKDGGE